MKCLQQIKRYCLTYLVSIKTININFTNGKYMTINAILHQTNVPGSYQTEFNNMRYFIEIDFNKLIEEIANKNIVLDNETSFFLEDKISNHVYRLYLAIFPLNKKSGKIDIFLIEKFVNNIQNISLNGTIVI